MPKAKSKSQFSAPTDENPEWTEETFKRSRPVEDLLPPEIVAQFAKRGRPRAAVKKVPVSMRLSPQVVDKFRAIGPGWQTAIDAILTEVKVTKASAAKGRLRPYKLRIAGSELLIQGKDGKIVGGRDKPQADKKRA